MNRKFECGVTAGLLGSGATLAIASHCAAVIGAAGTLLAHSTVARLMFVVPILGWPAACYLSVRVAIDSSLFRELALDDGNSEALLDELLHRRGLGKQKPERTIGDRSERALKLWKRLIAITGIQIAASLAAVFTELWVR